MIDLKLIKYRLIGIAEMDNNTSEDSVIDITKKWSEGGGSPRYGYQVVSGNVHGMGPGRSGEFSTGSRIHAYCVPVGGGGILPDLKEGDYIINRTKGSKAWRYTHEFSRWQSQHGDMSSMRYATYEEERAAKNEMAALFKPEDIVVSKGDTGSVREGSIVRVRRVDAGCVHSYDFPEDWNNYKQEKFRNATLFEIEAYKNGFKSLQEFKGKLEREAMSRFPSPASFTDVFGRKYIGISYEFPEWEDEDKLVLSPGYGVVYYMGHWGEPANLYSSVMAASKRYAKESNFGIHLPKSAIGLQSLEEDIKKIQELYGGSILEERPYGPPVDYAEMYKRLSSINMKDLRPSSKITGRKFDEKEFLSNPMNKKMGIPAKKTYKISAHKRINF